MASPLTGGQGCQGAVRPGVAPAAPANDDDDSWCLAPPVLLGAMDVHAILEQTAAANDGELQEEADDEDGEENPVPQVILDACRTGDLDILETWQRCHTALGLSPRLQDLRDAQGATCLHYAARGGQIGVLDMLARMQVSDPCQRAISDNFVLLSPPARSLAEMESSTDAASEESEDLQPSSLPVRLPSSEDGESLAERTKGLLNKQYLLLAERKRRASDREEEDRGEERARTLPSKTFRLWRGVIPLPRSPRVCVPGPRGGGGYLKTFMARYSDLASTSGSSGSGCSTDSRGRVGPRRLRNLLSRFSAETTGSSDSSPQSPAEEAPATKADCGDSASACDTTRLAAPAPPPAWSCRPPPPRPPPRTSSMPAAAASKEDADEASSDAGDSLSSCDGGGAVDDGFCSGESWTSSSEASSPWCSGGGAAAAWRCGAGGRAPVLHRTVVGATPLHDAAALGQLAAMRWLLRNTRCHLHDTDYDGNNVLHLAAR
ncbi:Espin [Frankliniella fusca]|uniref:Espin n=1 Tax=Frankliniella fusca TaxID=407009 RepID=A0AAE1GYN7_9NEOP|nr:Espin [Frankliniella fusca]